MWNDYLWQLIIGARLTVYLSVTGIALGLMCSFLWVSISLSGCVRGCQVLDKSVALIQSIPELLVLYALYFGLQVIIAALMGHYVAVNAFTSGALSLGLIFSCYFYPVLKTAYQAMDTNQLLAADAFGLTKWLKYKKIGLPQLFHYALPGFGNLCLVLIKDSAIVSLIGLNDLMQVANTGQAATGQPIYFFGAAAVLYLLMSLFIQVIMNRLKKRRAFSCLS